MRNHALLTARFVSLLVGACCLTAGPALAQVDLQFPTDTNMVNVKTQYGAKGDGVTDDTAAIQRAITENVQIDNVGRTLFFPSGTYIVSDTLRWQQASGRWSCLLSIQGQNRNSTIIKLHDRSPGYNDPNNSPKDVIKTANNGSESGNESYRNSIWDITVDTGVGNPGAIGIEYHATNSGSMRNVTVRSGDGAGVYGVENLESPTLIKNVEVDGFDYGITGTNSSPIDGCTVNHQNKAGILIWGAAPIYNLNSQNSVPAIVSNGSANFVTLVNATLNGGSGNSPAIQNTDGALYLRNVSAQGYGSALQSNDGPSVSGNAISEYTTYAPQSQFQSPLSSLQLPIQEQPYYHDNNLSDWVNVKSFGANEQDWNDDSDAIQSALDSAAANNKTTVYFPTGNYVITKTLTVHGSVRRLLGFGSVINIGNNNAFSDAANPQPVFHIQNTNGSVFLEHFYNDGADNAPGLIWIKHDTANDLALRDILFAFSPITSCYTNTPGVGNLYLEMVAGDRWNFTNPQNIWWRMCNDEAQAAPGQPQKITNNGANLWILGVQTEGENTFVKTIGGGSTEVLGACLFENGVLNPSQFSSPYPAMISIDSNMSFVGSIDNNGGSVHLYHDAVQETRNGSTQTLSAYGPPSRTGTKLLLNLYTGYPVNLISNPSFEADPDHTNVPTGWSLWGPNPEASFTESYGGAYQGLFHGAQWKSSAYACDTYQTLNNIPNGTYTLSAWVQSSGGQNIAHMYAAYHDAGNTEQDYNIPAGSAWQHIVIPNIQVQNNSCEIGFYSDANPNNWIRFDNVQFYDPPTAKPIQVTGLKAAAGNAKVAISWPSVSGATSYVLYRATASGAETVYKSGLTSANYTDTGVNNGTTYYYQAAAVNGAGTGIKSSELSAQPLSPPSAPTNVSATAGAIGSRSITLKWTAGSRAATYTLYRSTSSTGTYTQVGTSTGTSWTNTGLIAGSTYWYKVAAVNAGGYSPQSVGVGAKAR